MPKRRTVCLSIPLAGALLGPAFAGDAEKPEDPAEVATPSPREPGLLREIAGDFRRFVSRDTLITLGVGGALSVAVSPWDRRITESFRSSASLDSFFEVGDPAGGGWAQGGAALGTYAIGKIFHEPGVADLGRDLVRAQVLNGVLTQALKVTVRRERPDSASRQSFPSGHSSAAFATATVLERHYGWKAGGPAYALAAYIAASRLQENKHFPSDVVFGAALGIAAGRSLSIRHAKGVVSVGPACFAQGPGLALTFQLGR
jgi:acid phosphatase family membrane protein YuiD